MHSEKKIGKYKYRYLHSYIIYIYIYIYIYNKSCLFSSEGIFSIFLFSHFGSNYHKETDSLVGIQPASDTCS